MEGTIEITGIRKVLRSEITWILTFLGAAWGIVVSIVLPLQSLQIQMAQTAKDIAEIKTTQSDIPQLKADVQVLQAKLDAHINNAR